MTEVKLASRLAGLQESATLALNARIKQLESEGKTVYNFTAGELATDTPKYIQAAVAKNLAKNKYTPVAGLSELRLAIAEHAQEFYGLQDIKPDNVVVTGGAKPALYATFLSILNAGDEVIVPIPAWVSYMDLITLASGNVVEVPLSEDYDLNLPAIKAAITQKTKAILLNSPHNPTGSIFSTPKVQALAKELKGSNIMVISDDIYSKLVFNDGFMPVSTAGFDNLVIINGFSKSQALTGWRIGYLIADQPIAKAATALLSHINGNAPLPSQYAGLEALRHHDKPPAKTLIDLKRNRDIVIESLKGITDLKHNIPRGAFYVFLDLTNISKNGAKWCEDLLINTGVALVPGEAFRAPGFARLTISGDEKVLEAGLKQMRKFAEKSKA